MINSNTLSNHNIYPRMNSDIENCNLEFDHNHINFKNQTNLKNMRTIWIFFVLILLILLFNYWLIKNAILNHYSNNNLDKVPETKTTKEEIKINPMKDETKIQTRPWQKKIVIETIPGEFIKYYTNFLVSFNTTIGLPNYTRHIIGKTSKRCSKNYMVMDKELGTRQYKSFPYPPYHTGHLVPAVDIYDSCSTFIMSNAVPQIGCFNSGPWKSLETHIRKTYKEHVIYTVPEYSFKSVVKDRKNNMLPIPIGFYKIIVKNNILIRSYYLEHNIDSCKKKFEELAQNKLPYFVKNL